MRIFEIIKSKDVIDTYYDPLDKTYKSEKRSKPRDEKENEKTKKNRKFSSPIERGVEVDIEA